MKFKKLVSLITSAAIAASCAVGMFVFDAGAAGDRIEVDTTVVTDDYAHYIYDYYKRDYNGAATFTKSRIKPGTTRLAATDLTTLSNLAGDIYFEFEKSGITYKAILRDSDFNGFPSTISGSLDLDLIFSKNSSGGVKISSSSASFNGFTVKYVFPNSGSWTEPGDFEQFLNNSGVETNDQLLVYSLNPQGATEYSNIIKNPKNQITLEMKDSNYTSTGLYITKYDSKSNEYLKRSEIEPLIVKRIYEAIGKGDEYSEDPASVADNAVKDYVDGVKRDIINDLFVLRKDENGDPILVDGKETYEVKYVSQDAIDDAVTKYYNNVDPVTGKKTHLIDLANLFINTEDSRKILENAVYDAFGLDMTARTADELIEAITPDIKEKMIDQLVGTATPPEGYATNISYFMSGLAFDEVKALKKQIDDVAEAFKDPDSGTSPTLAEILTEINKMKSSLVDDDGNKKTLSQILDLITDAKNNLYYENGTPTTLDRIMNSIANSINTARSNALKDTKQYLNDNNYIQSKDISDLATQKYVDAKYAALQTQINDLTKLLSAYGIYANYPYTSNIYDWAYGNDLNTDRFITQVTNAVANRLSKYNGYGYGSGLSAYDIAVKNGFRGTEKEWLNSLVGESAYEIAVEHGYKGSETAWLNSLKGEDGKDGKDGKDGRDGRDGRDGSSGGSDRVVYVYGNQSNSAAAPANNSVNGMTEAQNIGSASRSANPATGAAAGIIIPAAAAASLFLAKKSKRRRGRK